MSFSPLTEKLIQSLRALPTVGPKTAQRMAFCLLQRKRVEGLELAKNLSEALHTIGNCKECRNFTEDEICHICADTQRNQSLLCITESPADVVAIEQTNSFKGYYFILMGHLSPLDGIGPDDIGINLLLDIVKKRETKEVIIATNNTPEGEATAFFISQKMHQLHIKCSKIAHGIPSGGELEYLDNNTVAKALSARTHIETT